jgi:hypothetical protein
MTSVAFDPIGAIQILVGGTVRRPRPLRFQPEVSKVLNVAARLAKYVRGAVDNFGG